MSSLMQREDNGLFPKFYYFSNLQDLFSNFLLAEITCLKCFFSAQNIMFRGHLKQVLLIGPKCCNVVNHSLSVLKPRGHQSTLNLDRFAAFYNTIWITHSGPEVKVKQRRTVYLAKRAIPTVVGPPQGITKRTYYQDISKANCVAERPTKLDT